MKLCSRTVELDLANTWNIARESNTRSRKVVIVELEADSGLRGIGEAAPIIRYNETSESVHGFLRQIDASKLSYSEVEGSMRYLDSLKPGNMAAKCAVNVALMDLAARKAQKPLHDFLGLAFQENTHVSSFTIGVDTPEMIRRKVEQALNLPVLKMKVGVPGDRENLRTLREVAPGKRIRVDANEGWKSKEEALGMIEWLAADGHVEFVEQPMPARNPVADWAWLKSRSPLPIFADESFHTCADLSKVTDCFHGVNVKLAKSGGVSEGFRALGAARRAGLKTMIGCMIETSVLISAAAHLAQLCDYLDLDGNILTTNDPFKGIVWRQGTLSFADAQCTTGLRVSAQI